MENEGRERRLGLAYITLVYLAWGLLPAYWKLMRQIDPLAILAHRALWSFVFLLALLAIVYRPKRILEPLKDRKTLLLHLLASLSLAIQWVAYLLAITTDHLVDLSMGYYIYPIVVVFLGMVFLKERMTSLQKIALALAAVGVSAKVIQYRSVPVLALTLAFSFAVYSIVKKKIKVNSLYSIFYEILFMLPLALGYAIHAEISGPGYFSAGDSGSSLLLMGGGVATASTLLLFAAGARRIPIFTVGFLQYISPTMVLLLGIFAYGEEFGPGQLIVFGFVWLAVIISSVPAVLGLIGKKSGPSP
jgi:chloramphenicol-sensitive protein RarD